MERDGAQAVRRLLGQAAALVLMVAGWYAATLLASYLLYPAASKLEEIDVDRAETSIYYDNMRQIVYEVPALASAGAKGVFILGGSNARMGLRPDLLRPWPSGFMVHNLAAHQEVRSIEEAAGLLFLLPAEVLRGSVFVLGVYHGSFWNKDWDRIRPVSPLKQEALLSRLYRLRDGGLRPAAALPVLSRAAAFLRPILMFQRLLHGLKRLEGETGEWLHIFLREGRSDMSVFGPVVYSCDAACRKVNLEVARERMEPANAAFREEPFRAFEDLCRRINAAGAALIIVDLPTPEWVRGGSVHQAFYRTRMAALLKGVLRLSRTRYLDLETLTPDEGFQDATHPKAGFVPSWSAALRPAIDAAAR